MTTLGRISHDRRRLLRYAEYVPGLVAEIERLRADRDTLSRTCAEMSIEANKLRRVHEANLSGLAAEVAHLRGELSEAKLALEMSQAERNRLLDDRDKTMIAVVNGTAERIAAWIGSPEDDARWEEARWVYSREGELYVDWLLKRLRSGVWKNK